MPVQGTTHHHLVPAPLVEEDVLVEGTEDDKETPVAKARVGETAARPKLRMLTQKLAGGFHGCKVGLRHRPVRVMRIPRVLPFHVSDEIAGLAEAHAAG